MEKKAKEASKNTVPMKFADRCRLEVIAMGTTAILCLFVPAIVRSLIHAEKKSSHPVQVLHFPKMENEKP